MTDPNEVLAQGDGCLYRAHGIAVYFRRHDLTPGYGVMEVHIDMPEARLPTPGKYVAALEWGAAIDFIDRLAIFRRAEFDAMSKHDYRPVSSGS